MLSRLPSPAGAIQNALERGDLRQRKFQKDLARTTRKHERLIRKTTSTLRSLLNEDRIKCQQDNRRQLFTTGMIGEKPPAWSLRLAISYADLPELPPLPYYPTAISKPSKRFSNKDFFEHGCLSPIGRKALEATNPLPKGWKEYFIKVNDDLDVPEAPVLEEAFRTTVDVNRTYYYHEETGQVSFIPPPGSSKLAYEAFKNFGHIGLGLKPEV